MAETTTTGGFSILRQLGAGRPGQVAVIAVLSVLSTGATLALPWAVGRLIGAVGTGGPSGWVLLLVALGLGSALANAGATLMLSRLGQRLICTLRIRTMRHSLGMRVSDVRAEGAGNLAARITADTARIKNLIDAGPIQLPIAACTAVGTFVIMGIVDWRLLLYTVGAFSVAAVLVFAVVKGLRHSYLAVQETTSTLAQRYVAATGALKMIKAYRAEEQVGEDLAGHARAVARSEVGAARMEALMVPVINLGQQVALVTVIIGGGTRTLTGQLALADLIAFLLYLLQLTGPLMMIATGVTAVRKGVVAKERFTELFAMPLEDTGPVLGGPASTEAPTASEAVPAIRFRDVVFGYGRQPVLRRADFDVRARGLTAMVGLSGSGKTTAIEIVQRFVDAESGSVRVFGRETTDWSLPQLRSRIAYVDQGSTHLQESIRSNLTLGRAADAHPDAQLMAVLDEVGLGEEIRRSPDGLDTVLAGAVDLSGGQRQRLAIARAMLTDAPLVLLDEPSSQLDSLNEQKLRDVIDRLAADRAVLVVAHRISTVRHADHVIVFDAGRTVAEGSHDELMRSCPAYVELVEGQLLVEAGTAA